MAQLFPSIFNDKLSESLLTLLKKWLEGAIFAFVQTNQATAAVAAAANGAQSAAGGATTGGGGAAKHDLQQPLKVAAIYVRLFEKIPPSNAPRTIIEMLTKLVLKTERALLVEPGSILREPLMKYLVRFPGHTLDWFLEDVTAKDGQFSRFLTKMVDRQDHGPAFKDPAGALAGRSDKLAVMIARGGVIPPGKCPHFFLPIFKVQIYVQVSNQFKKCKLICHQKLSSHVV